MKRSRGNASWHVFEHVYPTVAPRPPAVATASFVPNEQAVFESAAAEERRVAQRACLAQDTLNSTDAVSPYDFPFIRDMLQESPVDSLHPCGTTVREKKMRAFVAVVPRAYEESYLREALAGERSCVCGPLCEGLKIYCMGGTPFVLREFLLPQEEADARASQKLPTERRLCVLCKRTEIQKAFYNIKMDGMAVKADVLLSDYRNLVGVPGEYCIEDTIVTSSHKYEGLLDPVVLHTRDLYKIVTVDGVRHLKQWRLPSPGEKRCLH